MGVRLIVEVLDFAPANLTPRERWLLLVLAESARDSTRTCWPGVEDDERFIHRSRLSSRSQRYAVLKALLAKGVLEQVRRGQKGVRAGYRIAQLAPVGGQASPEEDAQGPENQDAEREQPDFQGPDSQDADGAEGDAQGPVLQDAEPEADEAQGPGFEHSGSRISTFRVPDYGTPSPQSPQSPQEIQADASGAAGGDEGGALFDEPDRTPEQERAHQARQRSRMVHALVDVYRDATNGMCHTDKTRTVVTKAVEAGYTFDQIAAGLRRVAQDRKVSLHAEALRIAIDALINEQALANGDNVVHLTPRSTADQRAADALNLAAKYAALEAAEGGTQ